MRRLRERGIYALPDGSELVACRGGRGYYLYDPQKRVWNCGDPPDYEVDAAGRILLEGRPTQWRIEDLTDTGWTGYRAT
jgi:hypothetical protein